MIELTDVRKAFNQGRPNEFWAIRGISLAIEPCRATVLTGPSGSGKTTLLSIIGCLARPTAGRVTLHGRMLSGLPERFLTEVRRRTFGFVFQQFHLIKGLSARENIMLPAYPLGPDWRVLRHNAQDLLARFGMNDKSEYKVEWLSGGEAQRVAICRALINDPDVLIADEPTANLDTALAREFMAIIGALKEQGRTVILTSHDPVVYHSSVIDRRVEMRDGLVAGTQ